ncbi:hypothetical protein ACFQXB_07695 [Plastorhodobacter daqingensis]|uniref:Tryptophan-rich sensory protein n=1 Tax=Plastorhodobacter daqingensis TaxID=1387281 RepID=A0ABW2ULC8_9RHOB
MKAILVLVAAIAFVASPLWSPGFNGFDPNLFPVPQEDPPVQPAGWAFSIWGLIYTLLILHAGFGLLRRDEDPGWDDMRWPLFVSLGIGASWLAVAQTDPILATIQIWVMLIAALAALFLSPGRRTMTDAGPEPAPATNPWLGRVPVGIYAGWLTAASFVSIGLLLGGWGMTGLTGAALVVLPVLVAFAVIFQLWLDRAPEYGLTVIWAMLGILAANWGTGWPVPALVLAGMATVGLAVARVWHRQSRRRN